MEPVGEQLRNARLERNLTIEEIAALTKIRPGFLKSLEEGHHEELPGQFFVVSFVHQYATALGLDVDATVDAVRRELPESEDVSLTIENIAPSGSIRYFLGRANSRFGEAIKRHAGAAGKVALAVVLIGGSFFWLFQWYSDSRPTLDVDSASDATQPPQSAASSADVPEDEPAGSPPSLADPTPDLTLRGLNVEIQATQDVWVRALSDGATAREASLRPGERRQFRAESLVQITFGNAGGALLLINGEEQGAVGPPGAVRHVRITRDGWELARPGDF